MLVSDNEFGAPWNDQFYWVTMLDEFGEPCEEMLTISGPRYYDKQELFEAAQAMFPYCKILTVDDYAICG